MSYGCLQWGLQKGQCNCVCVSVCRGIKGGESPEEKDKEEKKNQQFVSFYPCLDALAGTFEGYRNGDSCTSTSEKDLDYSSVYLTDCCMAAGDSLLLLKLLWPKYCYTLYNTIYTLEEEFLSVLHRVFMGGGMSM